MARNSEKAMTALARWRNAKLAEEGSDLAKKNDRRPYLASHCHDLKDAERWRIQVIREISRKVSQIQNAGLGEYKIRDLNDQINKLLREKTHWEWRIIELGGKDFRRKSRMLDLEGKEVPGSSGYKYFGAARDLPGVRELFDTDAPPPPKKSRAELMKDIDANYYGFRDDDDGIIVPLEIEVEERAIEQAVLDWKENKIPDEESDLLTMPPEMSHDAKLEEAMDEGKEGKRFVSHVAIPTQKDVEEALLRRKKQELLDMLQLDNVSVDDIKKDDST
ncbi:pre-mRNA-splicing factor ISY1 homolog [Lepeophtheirus salmonis]|uniref:pre-mRNA-splicing factor ISY1 homolog n=1 Tax=Lepeophtheirus salmonis TaxID=72036 RepID=UPI001AEB79A0|nr:pre-mRNA-splicing factor ISY1 homolog [Lepeophtheirus salmonis]XP_040575383.1 pre-mRNA-splicing factor ISY1 homolog [Lepeophtheirus salmonis]XP_040575384.1 pre-mRNA-splicing factor ISY1 homolog [Lepeophtheirus salmonis]